MRKKVACYGFFFFKMPSYSVSCEVFFRSRVSMDAENFFCRWRNDGGLLGVDVEGSLDTVLTVWKCTIRVRGGVAALLVRDPMLEVSVFPVFK